MHTMQDFLAIKRNEELIQWGWTLKSLCWMKEVKYKRSHIAWFRSYEMFRISKSIETESRWDRKWSGDSRVVVHSFRASSRGNGNALKLNNGDGCTALCIFLKKKSLNCIFSNDSFYVTWIISQFKKPPNGLACILFFILAPCWAKI